MFKLISIIFIGVWKEQKKFHDQMKEEETPFGSTPSHARLLGTKKVVGPRANGSGNRRLSLNSHQNGSRSTTKDGKRDHLKTIAPGELCFHFKR